MGLCSIILRIAYPRQLPETIAGEDKAKPTSFFPKINFFSIAFISVALLRPGSLFELSSEDGGRWCVVGL